MKKQGAVDKVLIIESDPALGDELVSPLMTVGFSVARVPVCFETILALNALRPDVIIVDAAMVDRVEVCYSVRICVGAPLILVGADSSEEIRRSKLLESDADFYLVKPFNPAELVRRVRAISVMV